MKKLIFKQWFILFLSIAVFMTACDDDDDSISGIFSDGVFITNEGNFGSGNGSVSYYSFGGDTVSNDIFNMVNSRSLGDVVQSLTVHNNKAYIVVNGSGKIEVVTSHDFEEYGVISGVTSPRYFVGINNDKGYVTDWGTGSGTDVKVIDLNTLTVSKTITVGVGPERMIYHNNHVYVANSGGYGNDNTVSVIDPSTDEVVKTITLDADSPRDFAIDANGDLWILCAGFVDYSNWPDIVETNSALVRVNTSTNEVESTLAIGDYYHPSSLEVSLNGNSLFYGGGYGVEGIYKMDIADTSVPTTPLIDKTFYGFSVNPETGNIFACDAGSFTSNGTLYRYKDDGTELGSYEVGIGPNGTGAGSKRNIE